MTRKRKPKIITKPVAEMMAAMREDNPRIHSVDGDVKKIAQSLLWADWCELPSLNEDNGQLIGGHGRVMACEWLIQQTREWFDAQWELYRTSDPAISANNKERFCPTYWLRVPLKVSGFDEDLHKAMMIRLNNADVRGQSNEEMKATLLAKMKPEVAEIAMPDPERRSRFLTKLGYKTAAIAAVEKAETDAIAQTVQTVMADFTPEPESWEVYESLEEATDNDPGFAATIRDRVIESDDESDELETEPEVPEGGANVNADPPPGQKKQVMFPVAVILSERRYQQWLDYKATLGIGSDKIAFLQGHIVFKKEPTS